MQSERSEAAVCNAPLAECPDLQPTSIMIDFEQEAINVYAFRMKIPDASVHGRFFHLCQNVYKHVQSNGMQEWYRERTRISLWRGGLRDSSSRR